MCVVAHIWQMPCTKTRQERHAYHVHEGLGNWLPHSVKARASLLESIRKMLAMREVGLDVQLHYLCHHSSLTSEGLTVHVNDSPQVRLGPWSTCKATLALECLPLLCSNRRTSLPGHDSLKLHLLSKGHRPG